MTTHTINALTDHIRQVALQRSAPARKELDEMATAFELQCAELLTALGRIAVGSKTVLRNEAMPVAQLREALKACIDLAEAAIGMDVQPRMDG